MNIIIKIPGNLTMDDLNNIFKHLESTRFEAKCSVASRILSITGVRNGASVNLKDLIYILNEYKLMDFTQIE